MGSEPADGPVCHASGCKSEATVILRRDRKLYCRPHGLAKAEKLPRSAIAKIKPAAAQLELEAGAEFSPCRTWRYALTRRWGAGAALLVVGLNPSTADETVDDPTIRRCVGFAKRDGYSALTMANLFAFRATDPKDLQRAEDPVGPENDAWLERLRGEHPACLAAWGAHGDYMGRAADVLHRGLLGEVLCLGTTKHGCPKHPLYLAADTPLQLFRRAG